MTPRLLMSAPLAASAAFALLSCAATRVGVVHVPSAYLRSGPGTGYPVLTQVEKGDRLMILEHEGDWYRIALPREGHGWIYREMITVTGGGGKTFGGGFVNSPGAETPARAAPEGRPPIP